MEIKIKLADTTGADRREQSEQLSGFCFNHELQQVYRELYSLVGLKEVKSLIYEIGAFCRVQQLRREADLLCEPTVLHAIFFGNPGTGKTTVARHLAEIYRHLGIVSKGHLIEVERGDMVGEYIGHTAQKTKSLLKRAQGGVLFIDEAYSLCRGGEKDFGREAIDVLVKAMEDNKTDFVLILAGYNKEMEGFLASNPGLASRLPIKMEFPDYSLSELMAIADIMMIGRQYVLSDTAKKELERVLRRQMLLHQEESGNARTVRNLAEAAIRAQAVRILATEAAPQKSDLMLIEASDIQKAQAKSGKNIFAKAGKELAGG